MNIIQFNIGEVFPSDDIKARWIIVFSNVFNDIMYVNNLFFTERDSNDPEGGRLWYLFRLVSSHVKEAIKLLHEAESKDETKRLLDELPEEAQKSFENIQAYGSSIDLTLTKLPFQYFNFL